MCTSKVLVSFYEQVVQHLITNERYRFDTILHIMIVIMAHIFILLSNAKGKCSIMFIDVRDTTRTELLSTMNSCLLILLIIVSSIHVSSNRFERSSNVERQTESINDDHHSATTDDVDASLKSSILYCGTGIVDYASRLHMPSINATAIVEMSVSIINPYAINIFSCPPSSKSETMLIGYECCDRPSRCCFRLKVWFV